ncbi:integrase arm-type DNA-binding domain-containing protein, partial [Alishewanella sp. SMS9]|nr:integrase arm-type DNA-binding domain-containing protein [Alishewanella sp. SMS9]
PLTVLQVDKAKPKEKDYKLSDERGMFLLVTKSGGKLWRLKYRFDGREKALAIGAYPDLSLKDAREIRDKARNKLAKGIDPSAEKQAKKLSSTLSAENSFELIAREWFAARMAEKSATHQARTQSILNTYLFPFIGRKPIQDITPLMLLDALRKMEAKGIVETARRAKQTASQVFRYAIITGRAEHDPAADLKGALQIPKKRHFAAITEPKQVGGLMLAIDSYHGSYTVQAALKCSALWFCRPGELRALEWANVNWDEKRIEIIAEKTHQQHIIPLCTQAIELLESMQPISGHSKYVFPSNRGMGRPMSENTVRVALRTMGYGNDDMTAHGFRAMARNLLDEVLNYRVEWIEQQLAHSVKDANGRAYNRTKHLLQRFEMMQRWADYLDELKAAALTGNVINAKFG